MTRLRETVHHINQALTAVYEAEFARAEINLTVQQFAVLEHLARLVGPSQTALTELTHIDRSTMADIVRRLCKKGLIERRRSKQDTRRNILQLTTKGREMLLRAQFIANTIDKEISSRSPSAVKGLETKLKAIASAAVGSGVALVAAE